MHLDWMTAAGVQHYSTIDPQDIPFEPESEESARGTPAGTTANPGLVPQRWEPWRSAGPSACAFPPPWSFAPAILWRTPLTTRGCAPATGPFNSSATACTSRSTHGIPVFSCSPTKGVSAARSARILTRPAGCPRGSFPPSRATASTWESWPPWPICPMSDVPTR